MSWECRTDPHDGSLGLRWGQVVSVDDAEICFLGFASDEGVRRNQGRVGAADGPTALRKSMASLAVGRVRQFCDLGDVNLTDQDLESAQVRYAEKASEAIAQKRFVVGLGGGHEIAYASYSALRLAEPNARIGMLYFDAHFDLRTDSRRTSGTPFRDALQAESNASAFAIGINPSANTQSLFQSSQTLGVEYLLEFELSTGNYEDLRRWLDSVDVVHCSFDLDVLPASEAPGVSAPAGFGVSYAVLRPILRMAAESRKIKIFDVAELNPRFDIDGRTARLAARIIWDVVEWRI